MAHVEDRRTFLTWAINGLGAIFTVILGFPIVAFLIDPRNRRGSASQMKRADGVRLSELSNERPVQQGVIRDIRHDAWTLYPNDVLGRVWVVLQPGKQIPTDVEQRRRLSTGDDPTIKVFTTICPHLGCSVNLAGDGRDFICPCHAASFDQRGERLHPEHNPAQRGMDTLQWRLDPDDPEANRILVEYRNFKSSVAEKTVIG